MNFDQALSYLLSLGHETLTIKLGLANTEALLHALDNPHQHFHKVQIAGTNGKGSVAVTLDSICCAAGIRVGLFTSPHLVSITERISINGEHISEDDFARFTEKVKSTAEVLVQQGQLKARPTFFEHVTAIALLAFREAKVELAILETGLGGRLDSTTAAAAEVVAITQVAMDHEEYLGHSLAEIAAEKAAIIRPRVTAVIAPQEETALRVILNRCKEVGVEPRLVDSGESHALVQSGPTSIDGRFAITLTTEGEEYKDIRLGLRGRHQIVNALTAVALAEALRDRGFPITVETIIKGVESAKHPGRLEIWEHEPRILLDGAHNPAAAQALRDYLDEFVKAPFTMIFGAMRDKALEKIAALLFIAADELILTSMDNPRAANMETLMAAVPEGFDMTRTHAAASTSSALQLARELTPASGVICVTGSLYLVGAVHEILSSEGRSG